jgi:Ca2+-binding EF-hand superfamily protein
MTYIATQLPEKEIHHLGVLFEQIDTNSDGYLTIDELQTALEKQHENTSIAELRKIIDYVDTDKNGKINYSEFLTCCLESSLLQTEQYLEYVFKELDEDKSGKISKEEIKRIFEEANLSVSCNVDKIIQECDKNSDGEIDYKEFLEAMKK